MPENELPLSPRDSAALDRANDRFPPEYRAGFRAGQAGRTLPLSASRDYARGHKAGADFRRSIVR